MNLEEYKEWIEKNGNKEEKMAYEVARKIVHYHTWYLETGDVDVECLPRFLVTTEKEKLEFDLIIRLSWESNRFYERYIGVEFKETDISRCIAQAIMRREHVDYMYIATQNVLVDSLDLLRMIDYGIGWIVWDTRFVKMLFGSKADRRNLTGFIKTYARRIIEETLEEIAKERKVQNGLTLLDFVED